MPRIFSEVSGERLSPLESTTIMSFLMRLQTRRLLFIFFESTLQKQKGTEEMEIHY